MDLRNHTLGVAVDALDEHRREDGRDSNTAQEPEKDQRIEDTEQLAFTRHPGQDLLVSRQQRDNSQSGRADGKALGDRFGGIAGRVEFIGHLQHVIAQPAISARPRALSRSGP